MPRKRRHTLHKPPDQLRSGADDLMDVLGKSVYASITGPFPVDHNQTDYVECILNGRFELPGISGTCDDLAQAGLLNRHASSDQISFAWDLEACSAFMPGDDLSRFLRKRTVHVRKHTFDLPDVLHVRPRPPSPPLSQRPIQHICLHLYFTAYCETHA